MHNQQALLTVMSETFLHLGYLSDHESMCYQVGTDCVIATTEMVKGRS